MIQLSHIEKTYDSPSGPVKALKGIDMLRFDQAGKIEEFEVMVRPMSGLQALGAAMGAKLASQKHVLAGQD